MCRLLRRGTVSFLDWTSLKEHYDPWYHWVPCVGQWPWCGQGLGWCWRVMLTPDYMCIYMVLCWNLSPCCCPWAMLPLGTILASMSATWGQGYVSAPWPCLGSWCYFGQVCVGAHGLSIIKGNTDICDLCCSLKPCWCCGTRCFQGPCWSG